ncbi:MAG TPA: hypothetical protein VIO61_16065 [Anaerolineaceae bacterium]
MKIKKFRLLLFVFLFLCFFTPGCSSDASTPDIPLPDLGVKVYEFNKRLHLSRLEGPKRVFRNEEDISLLIENLGNEDIAFPVDYGLQLFLYSDNNWVKIRQLVEYPLVNPNDLLPIPPSKGDLRRMGYPIISPYFPGLKKRTPMRVFVIGSVYKNGKITDERVGAYMDAFLEP